MRIKIKRITSPKTANVTCNASSVVNIYLFVYMLFVDSKDPPIKTYAAFKSCGYGFRFYEVSTPSSDWSSDPPSHQ